MKRCSTQHEATNLVWATRGKAHRDAATERMPEHDYLRCHLLEHRGHCFGVVAGSPSSVGCSRTPKPGQVECDRVDSVSENTASKSRWSRRHPCRARTHGVPAP